MYLEGQLRNGNEITCAFDTRFLCVFEARQQAHSKLRNCCRNKEGRQKDKSNGQVIKFILIIITTILASGCGPTMVTKFDEFSGMYEEAPQSILVLPPMNESTAADAKDYYSTTLQEPFSYFGYYVFPYQITSDILKMEGIYDSELLKDMSLSKFREYFGADAVLFTTIKEWDISYMIFSSTLTVSIDAKLKSTKTDRVLWEYNGTVVVDLSGNAGENAGLLSIPVKIIATAINTATADYVHYAKRANYRALISFPYGSYHSQFGEDKLEQFLDQTPDNKTHELEYAPGLDFQPP